jgi:hypothetical protein
MKIHFCAMALVLVGCVGTTDVMPIGNNQYLLTGRASGGLNGGKSMSAAIQKATEYCAERHQAFVLVNTEAHGMIALGGESTDVSFTCEASAR